jgi:RNA polymerase sigma-70 factor (ECF subfamily)
MEEFSENESWKNWFHRYGPKLLLCARQWAVSMADAEDVVQEAFIRFWRHQRGLSSEPLALLLTSVRRSGLDIARRRIRREVREASSMAEGSGPDPLFKLLAEGDDRRIAIESALGRLSPEQREVLVLKIWGELTFAQIAGQLGIPPNTAASRYRYALAALRRELTAADWHG